MIDIQIKPEAFDRVNKIKILSDKAKSISDELLMFEGLRVLNNLNFKIRKQTLEKNNSLETFLTVINSETLDKLQEIRSEFCKRGDEVFGEPFIQLYLNWEMLSVNESIKIYSEINPFEFFIRILERGVIIYKFGSSFELAGYPYDLRSLLSRENHQEIPYLISTTDEYLDKINDFYAEHNELPAWLEEDNKRGYLL